MSSTLDKEKELSIFLLIIKIQRLFASNGYHVEFITSGKKNILGVASLALNVSKGGESTLEIFPITHDGKSFLILALRFFFIIEVQISGDPSRTKLYSIKRLRNLLDTRIDSSLSYELCLLLLKGF